MRRRDFILLGSAVAWPLVAQAQVSPRRRPLIAWLSGGTIEVVRPFAASFLDGMRELGYAEGRDFDMAYRFAEGSLDRLPGLRRRSFGSNQTSPLPPPSAPRSRRARRRRRSRSSARRSPMPCISA
jgi:hypothetical protein